MTWCKENRKLIMVRKKFECQFWEQTFFNGSSDCRHRSMLIVFRKKADLSKIPFIVILEPIHPHVGLSGLQSLLRKKKKNIESAWPLRMRERTASFRMPKRVISRFRSGNVTKDISSWGNFSLAFYRCYQWVEDENEVLHLVPFLEDIF